jgi:hypothetical protein
VQRASESEEGAECVKLLLWSMQSWWAVKLRREADALGPGRRASAVIAYKVPAP